MNYDKIILELLSRVQNLEEEVAKLRSEREAPAPEEDGESEEEGGVTRTRARDMAIAELKKRFPEYVVEKAPRRDGSGILIYTPKSRQPYRIKFYHSRVYPGGHGWHVVRLDEVMDLSYCIFSLLDESGGWHFFLYGTDELGAYRDEYRADKDDDTLHLYFSVQDGRAAESRESTVDVTDHLDNWDVLAPGRIR